MKRTTAAAAVHHAALLAIALIPGYAPAIEPHHEYRKHIESSQNLTALKDDLFGERVSLYNGQTNFEIVDIELRGNNSLPVQLRRRFSIEVQPFDAPPFSSNLGGAGAWDIDVPYISGMHTQNVASYWGNRCSNHIVPGIMAPGFDLYEIWTGDTVHMPGEGDRQILHVGTSPQPTDGVPRKWTTSARDAISCIPLRSGFSGEGFRIRTATGISYDFDIAVARYAGSMTRNVTPSGPERFTVQRQKVYLLASRIHDRFGNHVELSYSAAGLLTSVRSNDGREITLAYGPNGLDHAIAAGRRWNYVYGSSVPEIGLSKVVLPDGTSWDYSYSNNLRPDYLPSQVVQNNTCTARLDFFTATFDMTIRHPSSAMGAYSFKNQRHQRSGVHASECTTKQVPTGHGFAYIFHLMRPNYFDTMSLQSKTISGPAVANAAWSYSYGGGRPGLWGTRNTPAAYPCTTCPTEKTVSVIRPDGSKVLYRYGFLHGLNDGRLLGETLQAPDGTVARVEDTVYLTQPDAELHGYPAYFGTPVNLEHISTAEVAPVVGRTIKQDGTLFKWSLSKTCGSGASYCVDRFGRPTRSTRSSQPAP